jgi:hypothetical protein
LTIRALINKEYEYLGFSLIKANENIDGGEILVQGKYILKGIGDLRTWGWIAHNDLIEGMSEVIDRLESLVEVGNFTSIDIKGWGSHYFTWMTLGTFRCKTLYNFFAENEKHCKRSILCQSQ